MQIAMQQIHANIWATTTAHSLVASFQPILVLAKRQKRSGQRLQLLAVTRTKPGRQAKPGK